MLQKKKEKKKHSTLRTEEHAQGRKTGFLKECTPRQKKEEQRRPKGRKDKKGPSPAQPSSKLAKKKIPDVQTRLYPPEDNLSNQKKGKEGNQPGQKNRKGKGKKRGKIRGPR